MQSRTVVALTLACAAALSTPTKPPQTPPRTNTPFEAWARDKHITAPKLRVANLNTLNANDGRGVLATDEILPGERICEVPQAICLDLATATDTSPCPLLVPTPLWLELSWSQQLTTWLLSAKLAGEAGDESELSGYIEYLPKPASFSDALCMWGDEELAELRYPPLAYAAREQAARLRELLAALQARGGPQAALVDEEQLRWAEQVVLSRSFNSEVAKLEAPPSPPTRQMLGGLFSAESFRRAAGTLVGGGAATAPPPPPPTMALMPMLDAMNHCADAQNEFSFDSASRSFILVTQQRLIEGEEVFLSYGRKGSDELLQFFGFVLSGNPWETVLSIGLDGHAALAAARVFSEAEVERRLSVVDSLGLGGVLAATELRDSGAPSECWHALRLLFASPSELDGDLSRLRRPASVETESRASLALSTYCRAARKAMGGSRKADLAAARGSGVPIRRRLALQLRAEKKRVLSELEKCLEREESRGRRAGRPSAGPVTL